MEYTDEVRQRRNEYTRLWRQRNIERVREQNRLRNKLPKHKAASRAWQAKNRGEITRKAVERARARRRQVLDAYGGKCACCGISDWQFLAIDHKNGGGERHRNAAPSRARGDGLMLAIIKANYPPEYRVLCHNCNQAKGYYGTCPHGNC